MLPIQTPLLLKKHGLRSPRKKMTNGAFCKNMSRLILLSTPCSRAKFKTNLRVNALKQKQSGNSMLIKMVILKVNNLAKKPQLEITRLKVQKTFKRKRRLKMFLLRLLRKFKYLHKLKRSTNPPRLTTQFIRC